MSMMTSKERITRQALGQEVDRVPLLGGLDRGCGQPG